MERINILIVDDEALVRDGLRALLDKEAFINDVYEAYDLTSFNEQLSSHTIDIVLMDIRLKGINGIELITLLKNKTKDHPKVVAVTGLEGVELIINLLKMGVQGIVFKLDGYKEILKTITAVMRSESYFPEQILKIIQTNAHNWDAVPPVMLTFQEKELLKGIASGMTTKEIAVSLKMTENTIETYRIRLIKKVGLSNTAALLAYSYRNGIL
jgi:DNA-binding NarL/FixJ family response regulator